MGVLIFEWTWYFNNEPISRLDCPHPQYIYICIYTERVRVYVEISKTQLLLHVGFFGGVLISMSVMGAVFRNNDKHIHKRDSVSFWDQLSFRIRSAFENARKNNHVGFSGGRVINISNGKAKGVVVIKW